AAFARLFLLATPRAGALAADAERAAAAAEGSRDDVPIVVRGDARFTCTMCGSCCGGHNVPVFDDVLEGLADKIPALEAATRTRKGLFVTLGKRPGAAGQVYCQLTHGSCVFLDDDARCRIHGQWGAEAKPSACRIFPYELVATPDGVAISIQRECRGFVEARAGKRLADDLPNLREVLRLVPELPRVRRVIETTAGRVVTWAEYQALEDRLHDLVDAGDGDHAALFSGLRAEVLGDAAPDGAAGTDLASLRDDLDGIAGGLLSAIGQLKGMMPPPTGETLIRGEALDHFALGLAHLRDELPRVMHPLRRPDLVSLLKDHLHHHLMGKGLAIARTVRVGLGHMAFQWALSLAFAVARAREVKRRHLVAQDVMDGLVMTSFMMRHDAFDGPVLARFDEPIASLFVDRWPALVAHARELPEPDTRLEMVKF
ncbi:MAG: YkgJ family cysteine cluster protein, partial [Myxococcales bacterium]|nr:YkgJ family cysteine cluster protein [Myxococcales bacterium]